MTAAQIADAFVTIFEDGLRPRPSATPLAARASAARAARAAGALPRSTGIQLEDPTMSEHEVVIVVRQAHAHRCVPGRAHAR